MENYLSWLPLVAFAVVFIVERVFSSIKNQRMQKQIQDLYDWHNMKDDEGVMIWYVRKSLEEAIIKLATNIEKQTDILQQMYKEIQINRTKERKQ